MSMQSTMSVVQRDMEVLTHRVRGEWGSEAAVAERPWLARAAAPLDCMGGFAEYSGSLTLTMPTAESVCCAAKSRRDEQVNVSLVQEKQNGHPRQAKFPLAMWYDSGRVADCAVFRDRVAETGHGWAQPVVGVLHAMLACGAAPHLGGGLDIALVTAMPWSDDGRALSAAAAATAAAVCRSLGLEAPALDAAKWCHTSATHFLGLPCGLSTALCALQGEIGALLQVRCQAPEIVAKLPLPEGITFVGIECGPRHPDADRKLREARTTALMGRRIIEPIFTAKCGRHDWGGWLARITINDYVEKLRDHLPTRMKGRDFVARYGPLDDPLAPVEDEVFYKVRSRTEHHVYENFRVQQFADRISRAERSGERSALLEAAEFMFASHWSYGQRCGLGSIETDRLVTLLRHRGPGEGIFGARICGCGASGAVAVMLSDTESAHAAVSECVARHSESSGHPTRITRGTSSGALIYGVRQAAE